MMKLGPFQIFLFDMDGTLLTSKGSIERIWTHWANRRGLVPDDVIASLHGRRAADAIRLFLPHISDEEWHSETAWIETRETADTADIHEIPGARDFLAQIPPDRRALVTSATRNLAMTRLAAAGITPPTVTIFAEDVPLGKPDPAGYALAAQRLGYSARQAVVFEDAAMGALAGHRAGAAVIGVREHHPQVAAVIQDYHDIAVSHDGHGFYLNIMNQGAGV